MSLRTSIPSTLLLGPGLHALAYPPFLAVFLLQLSCEHVHVCMHAYVYRDIRTCSMNNKGCASEVYNHTWYGGHYGRIMPECVRTFLSEYARGRDLPHCPTCTMCDCISDMVHTRMS